MTNPATRAEAMDALKVDGVCRDACCSMHPNEVNIPALVAACEEMAALLKRYRFLELDFGHLKRETQAALARYYGDGDATETTEDCT